MTFTFLSVILLLTFLLMVSMGVLQGMKKGLARSAIDVATVLLSALVAGVAAQMLSDNFAAPLARLVTLPAGYVQQFPSVSNILLAVADMLVTPVVFVPVFGLICLLLRIALSVVCIRFRVGKNQPYAYFRRMQEDSPVNIPSYVAADAPAHIRHDRLLGGIAQGFCGFLVFLMVLSPLFGTASACRVALQLQKEGTYDLQLPQEVTDYLEPYCYDTSVMVFSAAGGCFVYDALSISVIQDRYVNPKEDLPEAADMAEELIGLLQMLSAGDPIAPAQQEQILSLIARMEKSFLIQMLMADILKGVSTSWLAGDAFYGFRRPAFPDLENALMDSILEICRSTNASEVCADMRVMFRACVLLSNQKNNATGAVLSSGVVDELYEIFDSHYRMVGLIDELMHFSFRIFAASAVHAGVGTSYYNEWSENLASSIRRINSIGNMDATEQIDALDSDIQRTLGKINLSVSPVACRMAATMLCNAFRGAQTVTGEDVRAMIEAYAN